MDQKSKVIVGVVVAAIIMIIVLFMIILSGVGIGVLTRKTEELVIHNGPTQYLTSMFNKQLEKNPSAYSDIIISIPIEDGKLYHISIKNVDNYVLFEKMIKNVAELFTKTLNITDYKITRSHHDNTAIVRTEPLRKIDKQYYTGYGEDFATKHFRMVFEEIEFEIGVKMNQAEITEIERYLQKICDKWNAKFKRRTQY